MITLDPATCSAPLRRPWKNGIAVGRSHDLLREDLLEHLAWLQKEVGFRSCRFHAVFHDDMGVVRRRKDGTLVYQWHQIDKIYDSLLALGLKPFVELNSMPAALASGKQVMFDYRMNVTPPRIWSEWQDLVRAFTLHCVERYGLGEVRSWHFEVWNEPNLSAFWSGTKEEYFKLYEHAALAVKSVDSLLQIGGPATSKAHWLADFIGHCHAKGIPLDFVSTHLYPQDEFVEYANRAASPHKPGSFFGDVVREAKRTVASSPMPALPIHWSEWNTQLATCAEDVSWGENRFVDSLHGGSFVARNMTELDDAADTLTYWVASDIFQEGPQSHAPFSRTYGLLTVHGLPKAGANAFRLLERLRGPRIGFSPSSPLPAHCGGVATVEGESVHVLLWNDVPPELQEAPSWCDLIKLTLSDVPAVNKVWLASSAHIRSRAGSAFETWEAMGKPLNLSPSQLSLLRTQSEPAAACTPLTPKDGLLALPFTLAPNEVLHLEFRPLGDTAAPKSDDLSPEKSLLIEAQLGEKSRA